MHRFLLLAVVIGSSLAASPARATVLLQLELTDLVGRADQVFLGQAVASTSRWTAAGKQIVTDTIFEVRQSLRGARDRQYMSEAQLCHHLALPRG